MKRYMSLYDAAADGYAIACKDRKWSDARRWKKRLDWLDRMLEKEGESYSKKEV